MRKCPKCEGRSEVADTRERRCTVRRIRQCVRCRHRWTTYETLVEGGLGQRLEDFADEAKALSKDLQGFKARVQHLEAELVDLGGEIHAALDVSSPLRHPAINGAHGALQEV